MVNGNTTEQPTIQDIQNRLMSVLNGKMSREAIADWANIYVLQEDPMVNDEQVWKLLTILSGIDIKDSPTDYLHTEEDIKNWIKMCEELDCKTSNAKKNQ